MRSRNMPPITDPQLAMLIERVEHIARGMDDLKPMIVAISALQKDQERNSDDIKKLHTIAEMRGATQHQMDKRIVVLERWHRLMLAMPVMVLTVVLAAGGYAKSFLDALDDFKNDTRSRISSLEFIINSPHFERAMANDSRPVAEGGKD